MLIDVVIKDKVYKAEIEDNSTANTFLNLLPLTLNMDYMEHEKYYYLNSSLPTNTYNPHRIEKGDIMLFGNDCIVVFYESFNTIYSYSRIGKIIDPKGLESVLGTKSVQITFKKCDL